MTKKPSEYVYSQPIIYCADCGRRLIRKHTVLMRRDDQQYAVYRSFQKEVMPYCVYGSTHEQEGRARRAVR